MLNKITSNNNYQTMNGEYSRILTAAVVNHNFCDTLLSNPAKAVSYGYSGEKFNFAYSERKRISSIRANSLTEFAAQLAQI